ncbi:MAG: HAMP domain-containing protein [Myxococcales bacterium]|nr:HAMP domain-containing protein [Myxococcales bacterium]
MSGRPRISIPTRIFLGYAVVVLSFTIVSGVSLYQHETTARHLRLVEEGYLPLVLDLGEAKATQSAFTTLLERILDDRDTMGTRLWLNAARRVRPIAIGRALEDLDRAEVLAVSIGDDLPLAEIRRDLEDIVAAYEKTNDGYAELFEKMRDNDVEAVNRLARQLRTEEQAIARLHRRAWRGVQRSITDAAARAADQETRAAWTITFLAGGALVLALLAILYANSLLKPLQTLHARVLAVSRGELAPSPQPITERDDEIARLAVEFEKMVEALVARDATLRESERLAAIGRMAAHVTHEVRNPLSSLGLNVELLADELPEDSVEGRRLMASIQKEIDRLTSITEDYLRLARTPTPRLAPVDLGEELGDVIDFVRLELDASNVTASLSLPEAPVDVMLDAAQFRQALVNLLRNAREAMPEGGTIEILARDLGDHVEIDVADEGEGVPEEAREHLFDLFYTTRERGTGLGLPLTRQIIDAHGGRIQCLPREPRGTIFRITLPKRRNDL